MTNPIFSKAVELLRHLEDCKYCHLPMMCADAIRVVEEMREELKRQDEYWVNITPPWDHEDYYK